MWNLSTEIGWTFPTWMPRLYSHKNLEMQVCKVCKCVRCYCSNSLKFSFFIVLQDAFNLNVYLRRCKSPQYWTAQCISTRQPHEHAKPMVCSYIPNNQTCVWKKKKNNVPYRNETNVLNTLHSAKIMLHYAEIHSCITRSNAKPKRLWGLVAMHPQVCLNTKESVGPIVFHY